MWSKVKERYHWNRTDGVVLLCAVVIGFLLRYIGYQWEGDNAIYQPDEPGLVNQAIHMAAEHRLLSDNFFWPAQGMAKVQAVLVFLYHKVHGNMPITEDMIEAYHICRLTYILLSVATIVVFFMIGNFFRSHLGAWCALLLSCSPYLVKQAKQVSGDTSAFFFQSVTMLGAVRYIDSREKKYLVIMSIGAALATMEKWHGGSAGVFAAIVILCTSTSLRGFVKRGGVALGTYIISIIAIAPNILWNIREEVLGGFFGTTARTAVFEGYFNRLCDYVPISFVNVAGILYIAAVVFGLFCVIRAKDKRYLFLLSGAVKIIMVAPLDFVRLRWELELIAGEVFLIAIALDALIQNRRLMVKMAAFLAGGVILLETASSSAMMAAIGTRPEQDIRAQQEKWCEENGITMENTISSYHTGYGALVRRGGRGKIAPKGENDALKFENGQLYRVDEEADYLICAVRPDYVEDRIDEKLMEENRLIKSFTFQFEDVFKMYFDYARGYGGNDLRLFLKNIKAIRQIIAGASIGAFDINVYDISDLPIYE